MKATKIQFSANEIELLQNSGWILTKNMIIEKICLMFASVADRLNFYIGNNQNDPLKSLMQLQPKISRGEKYEGLPYVMLDYLRHFKKNEIAAIRIFCWWGNFFSCTLHVKGKYMQPVISNLYAITQIQNRNVLFAVGDDEWRHDGRIDNYLPLYQLGETEVKKLVEKNGFIKISVHIPLSQWDVAENELAKIAEVFLKLVKD